MPMRTFEVGIEFGRALEQVRSHGDRITVVEQKVSTLETKIDGMKDTHRSDYTTPIIGAIILAVAAAGKITWIEALPSLMRLAGGGK